MTKWIVTAQAFSRVTGEPVGPARDEEIDPDQNSLFSICTSVMDVHNVYEGFWNDLNPSSLEIVFVHRIKKL